VRQRLADQTQDVLLLLPGYGWYSDIAENWLARPIDSEGDERGNRSGNHDVAKLNKP